MRQFDDSDLTAPDEFVVALRSKVSRMESRIAALEAELSMRRYIFWNYTVCGVDIAMSLC